MTVDVQELMSELNIDDSPDEQATLSSLIVDATDLVKSSVNYSLADDEYAKYPIFNRAVKATATALYYDRALENGLPAGVKIMLTHLQARLGGK